MPRKQSSATEAATENNPAPRPTSRRSSRGMRGIGIAGFDFEMLNQQFISSAMPINEAGSYGVAIQSAGVAAGATYWKAVGIHHLTPDENRSRHNIFVDALNESGQRVKEASVAWNWEGNANPPTPKRLDKPANEPGMDIPIFDGVFRLWIDGGEPSDVVTGIHSRHADERNGRDEILNSFGHHSFYVVFQRTRKSASAPATNGGAGAVPGDPIAPPVTPVAAAATVGARLAKVFTRSAAKIGLDANAPIAEGVGSIAGQVNDPGIIAGSGVGWVRLNFIIAPWDDPHDQKRPIGRSWRETYQSIIDGFAGQGLKIYGLISDQAMKEKPGGRLRGAPAGDLTGDSWIQRYAQTFVTIARMFGDKVSVFESFNEPDDWKQNEQPGWTNSTPNWIHPGWFATMLQAVHQAVRSDPGLSHIRIVSGPLQGLDVNNNAGAEYLNRTYAEGKLRYGWGNPGVPFPFDGVGYHLYIAEGERGNVSQALRAKYDSYMKRLREVIQAAEGGLKPIFISEIGWADPGGLEHLQQEAMQSACEAILSDPSVALGIWFCTQDFPGKPYGLYRQDGLSPGQRKGIHNRLAAICNQERELTILETIAMGTQMAGGIAGGSGAQPPISTGTDNWIGIVSAVQLNVRTGPGIEHAITGTLVEGNQVQVIGEINGWLRIVWSGTSGFVSGQWVVNRDAPGVASGAAQAGQVLVPPPGADWTTVVVANTWNRYRSLIERESARLGIDPGIAVAVLVAESNGAAFGNDGRMIIRFENHIFYNQWGKHNQTRFAQHFAFDPAVTWQGHQWRPDPNGPWQACHPTQGGQPLEWLVFDFARRLDESAAMLSISMGAPQIMGFNHQSIGYSTVREMFNAFQSSDENQLASLFRFMEVKGLVPAIRQGDMRQFATVYNGSGQAENYAAIMQRNLTAFRTLTGAGSRALSLAPAASALESTTASEASTDLTWRDHLHTSFAIGNELFEKAMQAVSASTWNEALRTAQFGVILNAYWAQLAVANDTASIQSAADRTVASLGALADGQPSQNGATVGTQIGMQQPPASVSAGRGGRKRALRIGIDNYKGHPLAGCIADARAWAATLTALGFEQPTMLVDGEATRDTILNSLHDLVSTSTADDVIVFQFAGHGIQIPDKTGDEAGGDTPDKDEALVPWDFTVGAFVIDDEIGLIFEQLPQGVSATCFIDCCHSGSITRELDLQNDVRQREMIATDEIILAHRRYRESYSLGRSLGGRDPETMGEVVFSAAKSHEKAYEVNGHGEFTVRATRILQSGTAGITNAGFMQQVTAAFGATPRQNPNMECATAARNRTLLEALAV